MNVMRFLIAGLFLSLVSLAEVKSIRWTYQEDKNSDFAHVLQRVNEKSGLQLKKQDFKLIENRPLATSHFRMYVQQAADLPVQGQLIRIWSDLESRETIQVEAHVGEEIPEALVKRWGSAKKLDSAATLRIARETIRKNGEDVQLRDFTWKDEWVQKRIVRTVKVKARRGTHWVMISTSDAKVVDHRYEPFLQADSGNSSSQGENYFSVPAMVYPIWEEYEGVPLNLNGRVRSELKYLSTEVREGGENPYQSLTEGQRYLESFFDPIRGLTEEGRKLGFWAMSYVKSQAHQIYEQLPRVQNSFKTGAILEGKYATVNFHPSVKNLEGVNFALRPSSQFRPNWIYTDANNEMMEMIPESGLLGKALASSEDALNRVAQRLADHNVVQYINDGFDEIQVYWAVTQLFESLRKMGFTDPELSTRPFHAYLYDTDISMRDNAYYTDDTINFTTYSSQTHNMARDNSTIWHELGHGVMDRMMGDHLNLADTGGLSEGMADFLAQLVIKEVTQGKTFDGYEKMRILNHTGFYLTSESHDDGEAYGGTMNDILEKAMAKEGLVGLKKVTDLTLEAMRLTRNHPALTANDWFSHMLFADERGNLPLRKSGELRDFILDSLSGRNFSLEGEPTASFTLKNGEEEITASGPGSRNRPINIELQSDETADYSLSVNLKSSANYQFKFPVTIKVQLRQGPIQGAIHWKNESDTPLEYVLRSEQDTALIPLSVTGKCDEVNRPDGSCVDYAYVQIWNRGEKVEPQAKKRFYLRVIPQSK